ncbi:hypothetical protein ABZY81_34675 [Streptomyces sp. NPDC006514]|uniref:hypothetical protein n=1 Tax=Streptomyces sp. NPDC006514 TaxID=3154308 RepID=UPI0033ABCC73
MTIGTAPDGPHAGVDGMCEHIRGALAGWVPGPLGVHVHRSASESDAVARLVVPVADAAEVTVLPGDGATVRAEWAAVHASRDAPRTVLCVNHALVAPWAWVTDGW